MGDIIIKVLRRVRTGEVVILETLLGIGDGLEHRHNLIFAKAGQRIKTDDLVLLIKVLAFIFAEIGKHRPVVHVMPVDHAVVGQRKVAVFLHIGHTVIAVLLVEAPFQIEIRLVHDLHHGIVNVRAGDGEPAYKVTVLLLHRPVLFKRRQLRQRLGFQRRVGMGRFGFHQCGDLLKDFGALLFIRILPTEHDAGEKEKGGTYGRPDHQIFAFHIWPPLRCVPAAEHTLAGARRHQTVKLGIFGKTVDKRHQRRAVFDQPAACVGIGDIAHLLVGNVQEL